MRKILLILTVSIYSCSSGFISEEEKLIQEVRKGMTKLQVVKLMGSPDTIIYGSVNRSAPVYIYYYYDKYYLSKNYVSVIFDSTGFVKYTSNSD